MGSRGLVPGRSELVTQRMLEETEDTPALLRCPKTSGSQTACLIPSQSLSFCICQMEAMLLVPNSPKSYLEGNEPGQAPLLAGHERSGF